MTGDRGRWVTRPSRGCATRRPDAGGRAATPQQLSLHRFDRHISRRRHHVWASLPDEGRVRAVGEPSFALRVGDRARCHPVHLANGCGVLAAVGSSGLIGRRLGLHGDGRTSSPTRAPAPRDRLGASSRGGRPFCGAVGRRTPWRAPCCSALRCPLLRGRGCDGDVRGRRCVRRRRWPLAR